MSQVIKRAALVKELVSEVGVRRLHRKPSVLESLFNKVRWPKGLQLYLKETSTQVPSWEICKFSKNTIFTEQL